MVFQFVELLRSGDVAAALLYLKHLAPSALVAYPEAFLQFKRLCLLLVYDKDQLSPVANEWYGIACFITSPIHRSLVERENLAGTLHSALLLSIGVQEPAFSLLIRYLVILHSHFHVLQG